MDKYNFVLVQVMDIYSIADDKNYRRQNVYKNHGFEKAGLILKCAATKQSVEALINATSS